MRVWLQAVFLLIGSITFGQSPATITICLSQFEDYHRRSLVPIR